MKKRELDAVVAEKVLGWVWRVNKIKRSGEDVFPVGRVFLVDPDEARRRTCSYRRGQKTFPVWSPVKDEKKADGWAYFVHSYSDKMQYAWEIVEELRARGEMATLKNWSRDGEVSYSAEFRNGPFDVRATKSYAESMELAICLAALKTVGIEVPYFKRQAIAAFGTRGKE